MSKRPPPAAPASPRKRKAPTQPAAAKKKTHTDDQPRLDAYFRMPGAGAGSGVRTASTSTPASPSKPKPAPAPPADTDPGPLTDEQLARRLALEEGWDLEALDAARAHTPERPTAHARAEGVIDVDLWEPEMQTPGAGSSSAVPAPAPASTPTPADDAQPRFSLSPSKRTPARPGVHPSIGEAAAAGAEPAAYPPLAVDPLTYPIAARPWPGPTAPYAFLAHALATLAGTRSRTAILHTLTNALRTLLAHAPAALCPALYLLSNTLAPPYAAVELGLGPALVARAVQEVSGLAPAALRRLYNTTGDAGDVAFAAKTNVRTLFPHPPLLVPGVYAALRAIADAQGTGAAKTKRGIVEKLLVAAAGEEVRWLVRTLGQNLRVGAVRASLLTALARAVVLSPPPDADGAYYAGPELLGRVKPLPEKSKARGKSKSKSPQKQKPALKGKEKQKAEADDDAASASAREELQALYAQAEALIKKVYVQHPNYDHIAAALLQTGVGLPGLAASLPVTVGIPLLPTLGSPMRSLDAVYARLGGLPFSAEFKYDGQRAQIHAVRDEGEGAGAGVRVRIFSRHLEDMTDKYPDVVALVEELFATSASASADQAPRLQSFIIDAEIVAIDPADGTLRTFQELSNRARRAVRIEDVSVAVCVFAFDLLYLDGEILLEKPFRARRALLRTRLPPHTHGPARPGAARLAHVRSVESGAGREAVEAFWREAVDGRCEGLMIKLLDSGDVEEAAETDSEKTGKGKMKAKTQTQTQTRRKPLPATYEPDKRTAAWLKLKKDYVAGLGDSLDLVPVGAWHGNGRKAQWWSPVLLAVWDPDAGRLVAVCKCMSGFSDAFYKALRERYPEESETCARTRRPSWDLECDVGGLKPEVYFKPQEVWEIRGAEITISPVSVAARGHISESRGLSVRFPRFVRVREDKAVGTASTAAFLANMYRAQQHTGAAGDQGGGGGDDGELVDVSMEEEEESEEEEWSEG